MIFVKLENHAYFYELSDIIRMYFGKVEITLLDCLDSGCLQQAEENDVLLISSIQADDDVLACKCEYRTHGLQRHQVSESVEAVDSLYEKEAKRLVKKTMYKLLSEVLNREYPWGILTGIRPVKLVHELLEQGRTEEDIHNQLQTRYLVSEDRIALGIEIAKTERPIIYPIREKSVSIYVGIPFCPSRCYYCSFTSNDIRKCKAQVDPYLNSLEKEIKAVSHYLRNKKAAVQTIYLGGGTPTALGVADLDRVISAINEGFGSTCEEFTCEAGRPDSITAEKLRIIKEGKVTRISINPQTMNDVTLARIGRAHDSRQIVACFEMARHLGFDNINTDLILGLPGEGEKELAHTLSEIRLLNPESVTVHAMAIKRASILNEKAESFPSAKEQNATALMDQAKLQLKEMGLYPYYLYRQKHMVQNLENIGYSKKGFECIYNIQIIEEKQSIVAFGADAVTKAVFNRENRLERQHNIKDIRLYIQNIDRQIDSKLKLLEDMFNAAEQ